MVREALGALAGNLVKDHGNVRHAGAPRRGRREPARYRRDRAAGKEATMTIDRTTLAALATVLFSLSPLAANGAELRPDPAQRPEPAPQSAPNNPNPVPAERIAPPAGLPSDQLARSGGIIKPPADIDPGIATPPPDPGPRSMPVIPPPGTPGGNTNLVPK
jgi:hypothetical protein